MTKDWLQECLHLQWRILTFRATKEELVSLNWRHSWWGLFCTWLAGIGRAWDNPNANLLVKAGFPSLAYVVVLALFLWVFIFPLRPTNWRYSRVFAFITMTALPGLLYAIPLEMMLPPVDAVTGNGYLLLIVASWRVALLGHFLWKSSDLSRPAFVVALGLPLSTIMVLLMWFDVIDKTVAVMGGFRYLIISDEKKAAQALKDTEHSIVAIQTKGVNGAHTVYRFFAYSDYDRTPAGFKEVKWDDPEYLPPTPVIAVARALGKVSLYMAPLLFLFYCHLSVLGKKTNNVASEKDK